MANIDEEDYLESLLKSMSSDSNSNIAETEEEQKDINFGEMDNFDTFSFNEPDAEEINTENDNLAEDNYIEDDDSEDFDSQLLSRMLLDDSVQLPENGESISEQEESAVSLGEPETEENESEDSGLDDTSIEDMLRALQENSFENDDNTNSVIEPVNDNAMGGNVVDEPLSDIPPIDDELADILALDDGMTIEDIPEELPEEAALSEEENELINNITEQSEIENNLTEKKNKKKKKFSFKKFFMKFDDSEDTTSGNVEADQNQQLIDEVYNGKDSLADEGIETASGKSKKKKEKKPKKEKKVKEKKVKQPKIKEPKPSVPQQTIPMGSIIKSVFAAAVICAGVIFAGRIVSYKLDIKNARELYSKGSYTAAYEIIQGLNIKDKDMDFYMKSRIMASLYQGMESYDNYMAINDETSAIAALVKTVSRKYLLDEQIVKYEIELQAQTIYARVLSILDKYGISEQTALDLNAITNYSEFITTISTYGGISQ